MPDLSHEFGADLQAGPTGDLAVAEGAGLGRQREVKGFDRGKTTRLWRPGMD